MLKPIDISELSINPFTKLDREWMLVTAGKPARHNTMTASWGGFGVIWNKNVTTVYIRPQRYTLEFVEQEDCYSLCFFAPAYKKSLAYLGSHSGRDVDKIKIPGLTPVYDAEAPYYAEASLVLICRKLYQQKLDPAGFIDPAIDGTIYPDKDYHKMFIGEILKVLRAD